MKKFKGIIMKLNNGLLSSTIVLTLMVTGCVKKQDNMTASGTYNTTANGTYNTSAVSTTYDPSVGTEMLETAQPLIYDNTLGTVSTTGGYTEVLTDNTVVTTNGVGATQVIDNYNTVNSAPIVDNYSGAYNNSNSAYSTSNSNSNQSYSNPYAGYSETPSPQPSSSSYSYSSSSTEQGGGIHLQIAALKDYYAAKEFKNSLSLDPKYSAYVKRGAINKVIISGIGSVNEANRLKERRFPGAFIVRNSGSSSSSSSSYMPSSTSSSSAYGSSYSSGGESYTDNSAYGSYSSSSPSASSGSIGVQIGAFSSRSKAQSVANAQAGSHHAIVEQGSSRGRTIYRVILTGFSSRYEAKRALSSGQISNGFVTTVH